MRDEFMITRSGKQYVLFAGLLDEAHEKGLKSIDTDLLQVPSPENGNVAVVKAVVEMEDGRTFGGIGDASPENVGRNIVPHLIRMGETRAKARALRDAVNVGATALEELSDSDNSGPASNQSARRGNQPVPIHGNQRRGNGSNTGGANGSSGKSTQQKARKSQVDLLKTLAVELRGENGVERLEERIGKSLSQLDQGEADQWIERLTPDQKDAADRN